MRNSLFGRLTPCLLVSTLVLPALAAPAFANPPMPPPHGFGAPPHPHFGAPHPIRHHGAWATGLGGVGFEVAPSSSGAETFSPNVTVYDVNYPDLVKAGGDCVILKLDYDAKGRFVGTRRVNAC